MPVIPHDEGNRQNENDKVLEISFLVEFKKVSNLSNARIAIRKLSDTVDIAFLDNNQ